MVFFVWTRNKLKIVHATQLKALSMVQGRDVGVIHYLLSGIACNKHSFNNYTCQIASKWHFRILQPLYCKWSEGKNFIIYFFVKFCASKYLSMKNWICNIFVYKFSVVNLIVMYFSDKCAVCKLKLYYLHPISLERDIGKAKWVSQFCKT